MLSQNNSYARARFNQSARSVLRNNNLAREYASCKTGYSICSFFPVTPNQWLLDCLVTNLHSF